jgi:hypothetical protein
MQRCRTIYLGVSAAILIINEWRLPGIVAKALNGGNEGAKLPSRISRESG